MRDFLKYTFASLIALLIFLGMSISGLLFLIILSASRDPVPKVKNDSILSFDLSVPITDGIQTLSGEFGSSLNSGDTVSLKSVIDAIDYASGDRRIVALYLHGDLAGTLGYAQLKELREALQRFQKSGKKIIAHSLDWSEAEYYLASVADTISMHPFGSLELNGLRSEGTFFAGALQKLGVGVQVTRVGKFKSAVEPFLLQQRSPENRQQTQTLLGDVWGDLLQSFSQARKLPVPQLQAIADRDGILEADQALREKLITQIAYDDEVETTLEELGTVDDNAFRRVSLPVYANVAQHQLEKGRKDDETVAVVYAEGDIVSGEGELDQIGGDRFAKILRELRQDENVKAVVLRVNSPGGSAIASEVIQRELVLMREQKPVVVSMGAVAASGGYWISTHSDRIFAESNTITGSIGVFGLLPNIQQLANKNGVTWDVVKTGQFADINTLSRPKNPQELAIIQRSVDRIYDQFLQRVAEGRKLPKAKVAEIAQGRVWSGKRAKILGLVDELGGLDAALQDAVKRAKLSDKWALAQYPRPRTFFEILFDSPSSQARTFQPTPFAIAPSLAQPFSLLAINRRPDPLWAELHRFRGELRVLSSLNDPRSAYARLPFNFRLD